MLSRCKINKEKKRKEIYLAVLVLLRKRRKNRSNGCEGFESIGREMGNKGESGVG